MGEVLYVIAMVFGMVFSLIAIGWSTVVVGQIVDLRNGKRDKDDEELIGFSVMFYERYIEGADG